MYNLDRYISDFLLNNKKLSAQGIGDFSIVDGQAANGAPLVEFIPNKQTYTTGELISYISGHEGKNKIVTGFDLESHFNQVQQFINIGTPWIIPGLGQVQHGKNRQLEFVQQEQSEHHLHERLKRKQAATEANYSTYETNNPATEKAGNTGTIVLTIFIILALGAGGYYFYSNKSNLAVQQLTADTAATVTDTIVSVPSSTNMNNTAIATKPPATIEPEQPANVAASTNISGKQGFRFVLNRTVNPAYAMKRYKQLKTYGTKVYLDSIKRDNYSVYKVYLVQDVPANDTARIKDSLSKYYGNPVKIEMVQ